MTYQENLEQLYETSFNNLYNPAHLIDALVQKLEISNDKELAELLGVSPSTISKIRTRKNPISPAVLVRIHELTDVAIADIRAIIGERRTRMFVSEQYSNKGRRAGD